MITFKCEVYVDKVGPQTNYDQKIHVRADRDESQAKYPQKMHLTVRQKNFNKIPEDLCVNDHLEVTIYPVTKHVQSKRTGKEYDISDFILMDVNVLEKMTPPEPCPEDPVSEELPF